MRKRKQVASHPILKKIERSKREKKISDAKIAEFLCLSERTLYRRYNDPGKFTATELEDLALLFNWRTGTLQKYMEVC